MAWERKALHGFHFTEEVGFKTSEAIKVQYSVWLMQWLVDSGRRVSDRVPCACVGGAVDPQVELGVKLVLHHPPVAHQTAAGQLVRGRGIQQGDLWGPSGECRLLARPAPISTYTV